MLSAGLDGRQSNKQPTVRYILHRWRRRMRASYQEMRATPFDIILSDLEYIGIEEELRNNKAQSN